MGYQRRVHGDFSSDFHRRKESLMTIMKTAAALILLATITPAQPAPKENPTWFIPSGPKPAGQDDQSFCTAELELSTEQYQTRTSEIILPEELEPRESVTMVAACSGHPARISQLLLHPHPGTKHQLGAVRIAAVVSPSLSSLMERMRRNTQSVLLMSLGFTPLSRAKLLPVQDSAAFSSPRTNSNTKENQQKLYKL